MRRIPFPLLDSSPSTLTITGQNAEHIRKVLRMETGDTLCIFDGKGNEQKAIIERIDSKGVHCTPTGAIRRIPPPPVHLDIAIALLKEKKTDELIRPLTELGAATIRIFVANRSIPVLKKDKVNLRMEKWQKLASESLKQCCGSHIPEILFHDGMAPLLHGDGGEEMRLLFWESTQTSKWPGTESSPHRIRAVFGPEGGLEPAEVQALTNAGYQVLGLGPRILRAPTAILAGTALLQHRYGDLSLPPMDGRWQAPA
ncbi:16S rRNA (uracil(1498)-N(3))-methyltransferase [Desulfobotulus sp. H1]|uniref:Ribosomal RNA small subunit methyltransferase E n=1 Tax=Desulfobotulus pelophilus TaxID=2823377 RepID=A0ABT3N5X7_9BACT|nr:RsmE family RNA methyltransferase [Desulfobotulus pelophilus]MCW7752862.1 16S rRNA (uracil(1498)-N(3))-methyltransferase [Desulfobotulus pelophilus]